MSEKKESLIEAAPAEPKDLKCSTLNCALVTLVVAIIGTLSTNYCLDERKAAKIKLTNERERYCSFIKEEVGGFNSRFDENTFQEEGCLIQVIHGPWSDWYGNVGFPKGVEENMSDVYYTVRAAVRAKNIADNERDEKNKRKGNEK